VSLGLRPSGDRVSKPKNCETYTEQRHADRRSQKPPGFFHLYNLLPECKGINKTNLGISTMLAIAMKIKIHGLLAVHTPESYGHRVVSIFASRKATV
jgi:hypothetical protein